MNYISDRIFSSIIQDINELDWNITDIHVINFITCIGNKFYLNNRPSVVYINWSIRGVFRMYLNTPQKHTVNKYMLRNIFR